MSRTGVCAVIGVVAVFAGCSKPEIYFRPVSHDIGLGPGPTEHARYVVATQPDGAAAMVGLSMRGLARADRGKPQIPADQIVVTLAGRNRLAGELTLPAGQFYLIDDDGVRLGPPSVYARPAQEGRLVVGPGQSVRSELVFSFPDGSDHLRGVGAVRLFWSAEAGGRGQSFVTKFIRAARPRVYYVEPPYPYPDYYYYYGPYPYDDWLWPMPASRFRGHVGHFEHHEGHGRRR